MIAAAYCAYYHTGMAIDFTRYKKQGAVHWKQYHTRSVTRYNAYQAAAYELALQALGDVRAKFVVDLGAGDGALSALIGQRGGRVTLVDNQEQGLKIASELCNQAGLQVECVLGSATEVPLPTGVADCVLSSEVIEHLDNPVKHVHESARLLKPGGVFVLTTPYRIGEIPMSEFHVHEFTPSELLRLLEKDFENVSIVESHHIFWFALYGYRFRALRKLQIGRYIINCMALYCHKNPFLRTAEHREKREYFCQITVRATRRSAPVSV